MTKTQLNKEYAKTILEAQEAQGRRATIELLKHARSIRKELNYDEVEYPLIHDG